MSEMQSLVDSLAQQRKNHLTTIENITIKNLKDMVFLEFHFHFVNFRGNLTTYPV